MLTYILHFAPHVIAFMAIMFVAQVIETFLYESGIWELPEYLKGDDED